MLAVTVSACSGAVGSYGEGFLWRPHASSAAGRPGARQHGAAWRPPASGRAWPGPHARRPAPAADPDRCLPVLLQAISFERSWAVGSEFLACLSLREVISGQARPHLPEQATKSSFLKWVRCADSLSCPNQLPMTSGSSWGKLTEVSVTQAPGEVAEAWAGQKQPAPAASAPRSAAPRRAPLALPGLGPTCPRHGLARPPGRRPQQTAGKIPPPLLCCPSSSSSSSRRRRPARPWTRMP